MRPSSYNNVTHCMWHSIHIMLLYVDVEGCVGRVWWGRERDKGARPSPSLPPSSLGGGVGGHPSPRGLVVLMMFLVTHRLMMSFVTGNKYASKKSSGKGASHSMNDKLVGMGQTIGNGAE